MDEEEHEYLSNDVRAPSNIDSDILVDITVPIGVSESTPPLRRLGLSHTCIPGNFFSLLPDDRFNSFCCKIVSFMQIRSMAQVGSPRLNYIDEISF